MKNMINADDLIQVFRDKQAAEKEWHEGEGGMTYSEIINLIIQFKRRTAV